MISKKKFVKTIENIKKAMKLEEDYADAISEFFEDNYTTGFKSTYILENSLIELLKDIFNDNGISSDIEYFVYELDFGKKWTENSYMIKGKSIDISTAEKLYDFLTRSK